MNIYKFFTFLLLSIICGTIGGLAQIHSNVTPETMQQIYDEVRTDYKYGLVITPDSVDHWVDSPTIFQADSIWYMTYIYFDNNRGYETMLARSVDLLHWEKMGKVLAYPQEDRWDLNQRSGYPALIDWTWNGSYKLNSYDGKYWMTYIGGHEKGYEAPPLNIGLAYTDQFPNDARLWQCFEKPIITAQDKDAQWWENMVHYKSTIYDVSESDLGHKFMMFYNAKGQDNNHPEAERVGIAFSDDMLNWIRYDANPVVSHDTERTISGDAQIMKIGDVYVMFYFIAFNPASPYQAYNTFSVSRNLVDWTDWHGEPIVAPSKPYDERYAHKSYVLKHDGIVYHFYCAVNNAYQRGIALATSEDLGTSGLDFVNLNE